MIYVGTYRYNNNNDGNVWKFKDCYSFLYQYLVKDRTPYTMTSYAGGSLQCNSAKNRTYYDLMGLTESHTLQENFSIEAFNKALYNVIVDHRVWCLFCPHIDNIVFCPVLSYRASKYRIDTVTKKAFISPCYKRYGKQLHIHNDIYYKNLGFVKG
jgi:hypothetical protein